MIKLAIALALIININCQSSKLPNYVGIGYDVAKGNPKTDTVDPGFRSTIFEITYDKQGTTEDNKYLVPDGMTSRNRVSCSYAATASEFTGTNKYQQELKTLVDVSASMGIALFEMSFSASTAYNAMKETTQEQHSIVSESSANCEVYFVEMPVFEMLPVNSNFQRAIEDAYKNVSSWRKVIEVFGTHFVGTTVLGGRTHVQNKLQKTSYQELTSMGVDVKLATQMKYAKFSGDASVDWHSYEKQVNAFENKVEETKEIYVGGKPPASGNWKDWQELVSDYPMPVTYTVRSLTELFIKDHFPSYTDEQLSQMKVLFDDETKAYCDQLGCSTPGNDVGLPYPAGVITHRTQPYGGTIDAPTTYEDDIPTNPMMNVRKVIISYGETDSWAGSSIFTLQFWLSDGINSYYTPQRGYASYGERKEWTVPDGEYIKQIEMVTHEYVHSLTFITDKGNKSPRFGEQATLGTYHLVNLQGNLVGAFGRHKAFLHQTGFITNEIKY